MLKNSYKLFQNVPVPETTQAEKVAEMKQLAPEISNLMMRQVNQVIAKYELRQSDQSI